MTDRARANLYMGLFFVTAAVFVIFVWVPLDTETGILEKARRRFVIGDALAPTVAGGFLLLGGLLLIFRERHAADQPGVTKGQLVFITRLVGVIIFGILVMRYLGPALAELVNLIRDEPIAYRILRTTPGWKHAGFVVGGIIIVTGMISIVERRFSRRAFLTALLAVAIIIAVFDLPFDYLQLPPNGDV